MRSSSRNCGNVYQEHALWLADELPSSTFHAVMSAWLVGSGRP
jgi:hypothetical protein